MIINCGEGTYVIGNIKGIVPEGYDCKISGFHFVNGRIVKEGKVEFIKNNGGKTQFYLENNIIENILN